MVQRIQNAAPSPLEQLIQARGLAAGQTLIGGFDVTQPLPAEAFGRLNKDKVNAAFRKMGIGITYDRTTGKYGFDKPVYLEDIIKANPNFNQFNKDFSQSLRDSGIRHGNVLSQEYFTAATEGTLPGAKDLRNQLSARAMDLLGLAEPGKTGGPADLVGRAGLEQIQQDIRGSYAARGLNQSGQAAFFEGTQGINFLEGLRQSRQSEGMGLLAGIYPELAPGFGITAQGQQYQRNTFWDLFSAQQQQLAQAKAALGNNAIFNTNLYGGLGSAIPGLIGSFGGAGAATGYQWARPRQAGGGLIDDYGLYPGGATYPSRP